ncbi:MAG: hypothetical protein LBE12_01205 [Planctomycetaceae bacterium]|jgi:hypothetical protein|nr:hypothetical protein [Planctomycetaceae bacterium]
MNNKIILILSFFILIFLFSVVILIGKEPKSTNPLKPMADQLKLQNYDTDLDKVDYTRQYQDVVMPWINDEKRKECRFYAAQSLLKQGCPESHDLKIVINKNPNAFIETLIFVPIYDELDNEQILFSTHNVNDKLLFETFPYIPEITTISFISTQITDEGMKSLFYLPFLKQLSISTTDSEKFPILVTSKGIEIISKHIGLTSLFTGDIEILPETISALVENSQQIVFLGISTNALNNDSLSGITKIKSLKEISLTHFQNTPKQQTKMSCDLFVTLSNCPELEIYTLKNYDFSQIPSDSVLKSIANPKGKIKRITLLGCKLHQKLIQAFWEIDTLESICIDDRLFKNDVQMNE